MAQTHLLDMRVAGVHRPGVHRHRINVVKHGGVRADLAHIVADSPQVRDGAQRAHNASRPQRIGNGLLKAMAFTDFKVSHGAGLVAANLEGDDDKIGVPQGGFTIAMAANFAIRADGIHQLSHHGMRLFQPGFIDIHQCDMRRLQRRALEHITENIFDEHRRTGADKGNFGGRHRALSIRSLNTFRVACRSPLRCPVPAGAFPETQIGH